jgi:peptide chain release factor 1
MINQLKNLQAEFDSLERSLGDLQLFQNQPRYLETMKRYSDLKSVVVTFRNYQKVLANDAKAREALADPELIELAREELAQLETRKLLLEGELQRLLLPKDPFDLKNVIIEIRAAAGGDEASLFAGEVLTMYKRYAEFLGFQNEILDTHATDVGGFSRASLEVAGRGAYSHFKYESGVHRVQRVPKTETQGRIHTSTVTVAVLPEAEDVDVNLPAGDYRVDVFRSSGPGGQSVNTTDSAVRLTYLPGTAEEIIVTCQDGKSQIKNKEKALTVLRARLLERERAKAEEKTREARLVQIGTGDRSEKIRTYNFPQSRVTDHRIDFTSHNLSELMGGSLNELTSALNEAEQVLQLRLLSKGKEADKRMERAGGKA